LLFDSVFGSLHGVMLALRKLFGYWRQNFAYAKERHEMSVVVIFVLWQAAYFASKYWGFGYRTRLSCLWPHDRACRDADHRPAFNQFRFHR
jgi:hypothetical protein